MLVSTSITVAGVHSEKKEVAETETGREDKASKSEGLAC